VLLKLRQLAAAQAAGQQFVVGAALLLVGLGACSTPPLRLERVAARLPPD
jgi:hypothetical protein